MDKVVTIFAIIKSKEGSRDALYGHIQKLIEGTLKEEGCIDYILHSEIKDENTFIFYENWKSAEALELHRKSAHMQEYIANAKEMIANLQVIEAYKD